MRNAICFVVTLAFFAVAAPAADWPGFRGPHTDGVAEPALLEKLAIAPVWKAPVGDAFGEIAVVGNRVLLLAERGEDEFCICLDAATGNELWSTRVDKTIQESHGNGPRSTPAIDGNHVYCLSSFFKITCLDLASGKQLWTHDLIAEDRAKPQQWGSASSPLVVGDLVLVTSNAPGKCIAAFNKNTGELAWAKTNQPCTHATPTVATIKGKLQVICFMKKGLESVDPATGQVLWTFPRPSKTIAASAVVGGRNGDIVYCSIGYNVGAAACRISLSGDKWTATPLWSTPNENINLWATPVYRDGYIYGLFGHDDGNGPLGCLDIETGVMKWSQEGFGSQGGLILVGDKLLILTPRGDLVLVPASSDGFKELDRANILPSKDWTAPTFANGMVFARNSSADGDSAEVVCLKLGH